MEQLLIVNQDQQHSLDAIILRNDFLNVFSELETQVCSILQSCGDYHSGQPFGQRLRKFRIAEKTSKIAKSNFPERDRLADLLAEFLPVRADIVHSRMKPCQIDGESAALFVNSQDASAKFPTGRAITLAQLQKMVGQLKSIQIQIAHLGRKVGTPQTSQQSSPSEAADPDKA